MTTNIYNPVSPTDTYCIYDQFHFGNKDHLEVPVKGHQQAIDAYAFYKTSYPGYSLGLCTIEYYKHLTNRMKQWT
jgi:hypothetical protein